MCSTSAAVPAMTREIAALVGSVGRVVGIDQSEMMVSEARRAPESLTHLEFRTGDVRKLDFPDGSFDGVRTDRVLMFVPEIEQALAEIFRVLGPGGRLVTSEQSTLAPNRRPSGDPLVARGHVL